MLFKHEREANGGACSGPDNREQLRSSQVASLKGKASTIQVPQPGDMYEQMVASTQSLSAKDFPIAVASENPLRFPEPAGSNTKSIIARPPDPDQRPLIARRVSGVVAMPYEESELKLSPGWNGQSVPSATPLVDSAPAQGTIASRSDDRSPSAASASGMLAYGANGIGGEAVALRLRR